MSVSADELLQMDDSLAESGRQDLEEEDDVFVTIKEVGNLKTKVLNRNEVDVLEASCVFAPPPDMC